MAQLLKVIQDPSIVANGPVTPMEALQLATEKKAAEMAAARSGGGLVTRPVQTYAVDGYGNPILEQQKSDAVARALSLGRANGKASGGGSDAATALVGTGPAGNRLGANASGYGAGGPTLMTGWGGYPFGYSGGPSSALSAIDKATITSEGIPLPRIRPNIESNRGSIIPTRQTFQASGDGGVFGFGMSPGMAEILNTDPRYAAQRSGMPPAGAAPPLAAIAQPNKTQQALAKVAAPVKPSYTTTSFQKDRFQTTTGAQMPGSTKNSRWLTGY